MTCSSFTCIVAVIVIFTSITVNSTSLEGSSSSLGHEGHVTIPEIFHWQHSLDKRDSQQLCGARLILALRALCRGQYVAFTRRSDPALHGGALEESDYHETNNNDLSYDSSSYQYINHDMENPPPNDFDSMWPYNPKLLALKIITEGATHQRYRRSVTEECCKKPCTRNEMQRYCAAVRS